ADPILGQLLSQVESLELILSALAVNQLPAIERKLAAMLDLLAGQHKDFYTVEEVAALAGRSEYTVRRWIADGAVTPIRLADGGPSGRLRIPRAELERLIETGKGARIPVAAIATSASDCTANNVEGPIGRSLSPDPLQPDQMARVSEKPKAS